MKIIKALTAIGFITVMGCTQMSVVSPNGKSTASYKGFTLLGAESVTCSNDLGCVASGQNLDAIVTAVRQYQQSNPMPIPAATPTPAH